MRKGWIVSIIAMLLLGGCASTFVINDAGSIPEDQRVKVAVPKELAIAEIDGEMAPGTVRGLGSPAEFLYILTPGVHSLTVYHVLADAGVVITFGSDDDSGLHEDTRSNPVILKKDFVSGKTYVIDYIFPNDYSIEYSIEER